MTANLIPTGSPRFPAKLDLLKSNRFNHLFPIKTKTMHLPKLSLRNIFKPSRLLFLSSLLLASSSLSAQCLVSSLNISTGQNNLSVVSPVNPDPHWSCVNKTGNFLPNVPGPAIVVTPNPWWATGGVWLSDNQFNATTGVNTTVLSELTFQRTFKLCNASLVTFDFDMRSDGFVRKITLDESDSLTSYPTIGTWATSTAIWSPPAITRTLSAGIHTIRIVISEPPNFQPDPVGFFLNGTISTATASIVNDQDPTCSGYVCGETCNDRCYWKLEGNTIISGHNIFGTLSDDHIRIVTNSGSGIADRGIITGGDGVTGGYLGWNNTNPTARIHVDCINGNNPGNAPGALSDVRFENLEPGHGNILVIDEQGYVYDSKVRLNGEPGGGGIDGGLAAMQQELRELKSQLAELRGNLANGSAGPALLKGNTLQQNTPNPFNRETTIRYSVVSMKQSAFVIVYDLNGRELKKYPVNGVGEGQVQVSSGSLTPGMYLYSLIVDGQETDTKKMVLSE